MVARENSRYFATPWLVSPPNHIWGANRRNSILMTCHYSDLGSASDWSFCEGNLLQPIRSTDQVWLMTRHQYGISAGVPRTLFRGDSVVSRKVGCFSDYLSGPHGLYLWDLSKVGGSLKGRACTDSVVKLPRDLSSFRAPTTQEWQENT